MRGTNFYPRNPRVPWKFTHSLNDVLVIISCHVPQFFFTIPALVHICPWGPFPVHCWIMKVGTGLMHWTRWWDFPFLKRLLIFDLMPPGLNTVRRPFSFYTSRVILCCWIIPSIFPYWSDNKVHEFNSFLNPENNLKTGDQYLCISLNCFFVPCREYYPPLGCPARKRQGTKVMGMLASLRHNFIQYQTQSGTITLQKVFSLS